VPAEKFCPMVHYAQFIGTLFSQQRITQLIAKSNQLVDAISKGQM
jgi:hypothetical protein